MKITITPIGSTVKNNASITNYNEQLSLSNWRWDDSKQNKAKEGELFAFFFPRVKNPKHEGKVIIHKILAVKSPAHRSPSWSTWVGQAHRNVLELSSPICVYTMDEWERLGGPMKRMGTYQTDLDGKCLLCDDLNKCLLLNENEKTTTNTNTKVNPMVNSIVKMKEDTGELEEEIIVDDDDDDEDIL